jgi:hypothetical protein
MILVCHILPFFRFSFLIWVGGGPVADARLVFPSTPAPASASGSIKLLVVFLTANVLSNCCLPDNCLC